MLLIFNVSRSAKQFKLEQRRKTLVVFFQRRNLIHNRFALLKDLLNSIYCPSSIALLWGGRFDPGDINQP
jgi:hypothetical protein